MTNVIPTPALAFVTALATGLRALLMWLGASLAAMSLLQALLLAR